MRICRGAIRRFTLLATVAIAMPIFGATAPSAGAGPVVAVFAVAMTVVATRVFRRAAVS